MMRALTATSLTPCA